MRRSEFIKKLSFLTASGIIVTNPLMAQMERYHNLNRIKNIGINLFSVPKLLEKDFRGGIKMLSEIGFKEIELFGPYSYSADSAKESWADIIPMVGFSGSGYFGMTEKEVKGIFKDFNMKIPAMHTDLDTLENLMPELGKAGHVLGFEYVILPAIPTERRKTLEDYKRIADIFNVIGENAKKEGLKFAYHNHGYGLSEVDGQIPLHLIMDGTDADLVFFEMDLFWTLAGKADPITYLEKYQNRYHLMHIKDMKEIKSFSGDGGDPSQWIELFPNMTSAGSGQIDLEKIIPIAQKNGVKHFIVEQDMVANPEVALKMSFDYLAAL